MVSLHGISIICMFRDFIASTLRSTQKYISEVINKPDALRENQLEHELAWFLCDNMGSSFANSRAFPEGSEKHLKCISITGC